MNSRLHFDYCISLDDDKEDRLRVQEALESFSDEEFGYDYFLDFSGKKEFVDFKNGVDFYPSEYSLVLLDVDFGYGKDRYGLELLKWLAKEYPKWPVILTTNFDSSDIYRTAKQSKNLAGYIVKSSISRNSIMLQLENWLDRQETEYLRYVEQTCNDLMMRIKDLENKQTSPNDPPRIILNNFNIRLYKPNLIEKSGLSSSETLNMATKIASYIEYGRALKLNYFPSNMGGAFQLLEGRIGGAKRFYFKPKNKSAIVFEISGESNKVINQTAFAQDLLNNRSRYQEFYDSF